MKIEHTNQETLNLLLDLSLMWNQYCGEMGHCHMTAGEFCSATLQEYGLLDGEYGEVDTSIIYNLMSKNEKL